MKKTTFFASAAALMLAACSQDEVVMQGHADNAIAYSVNVKNQTRAADSYCAVNPPQSFKVWAKKSASGNLYIPGDEITYDGSSWVNQTAKRYWPQEALTFYAEVNGDDEFDFNSGAPQFANFTVKSDVAEQVDLMYAVNPDVTGDASNSEVNLNFRHALSQVCLKAQNETKGLHITINAVGVGGLQDNGTYTLPTTSTEQTYEDHTHTTVPTADPALNHGTWALAGDANKYYEVEGSSTAMAPGDDPINISCPADDPHTATTDWSKVMTLMPQTVDAVDLTGLTQGTDDFPKNAGGYFKVYVTVANVVDGDETVLVSNQPYYVPVDIAWNEGYRYIYTLRFSEDWTPEGLVEIGYTVTVDDFINTDGATVDDPEFWGNDGIQYKSVLMIPAGADPTTEPAIYVLDRNLGAETPSSFGTWYNWGQTSSDINDADINNCGEGYWEDLYKTQWTYQIVNDGIQAAYDGGYVTTNDYSTAQLSPDYDAANLSLGGDWHIPIKAEWERFLAGTTCERKPYDGGSRYYVEFTSTANGNKVCIVLNGKWNGSKWVSSGNDYITLWSSTPKDEGLSTDYFRSAYTFYLYRLGVNNPEVSSSNFNRPRPIRPFSATGTLN